MERKLKETKIGQNWPTWLLDRDGQVWLGDAIVPAKKIPGPGVMARSSGAMPSAKARWPGSGSAMPSRPEGEKQAMAWAMPSWPWCWVLAEVFLAMGWPGEFPGWPGDFHGPA